MLLQARDPLIRLLRWSERYTKTDMVYLAHTGFWSNLNAFFTAFLSLVLYIAYAHFLSKEEYGTYQYLLSFFSIATAFTLTGMNTAVTRAVAQGYEGTLAASVAMQIKWGAVPAAGALAVAGYYWYHGNLLLSGGLVIIALGTPLLYAYNTYGALQVGRRDFRGNTLYGLTFSALYYASLIAAAYLSGSPLVVLGANLAAQVVLLFFLYHYMIRSYRPNNRIDKGALSYGKHLSLMNLFGGVMGQLEGVMVFQILGPVPLAIYSFASAVPERLNGMFFKFLGSAALPKFAERSMADIRSLLLRKMLFAYAAGLGVTLLSLIAVPILFRLFFPTYADAVPYALLYSAGIFLSAAHFLPLTVLTALRRTRDLYIVNFITPLAQLGFPVAGMLLGGLWGLIWGKLAVGAFATIISTTLVYAVRQGDDSASSNDSRSNSSDTKKAQRR
jgi:O-antigen/teichoic acid export membrane protein